MRLVELVIASAITATMKDTVQQIHHLIFRERRGLVTLKTRYESSEEVHQVTWSGDAFLSFLPLRGSTLHGLLKHRTDKNFLALDLR